MPHIAMFSRQLDQSNIFTDSIEDIKSNSYFSLLKKRKHLSPLFMTVSVMIALE